MNEQEIVDLIRKKEGIKLDFKLDPYKITYPKRTFNGEKAKKEKLSQEENKAEQRQTDELIKDVIALTNGNIGHAGKDAYLIIGAEDKRNRAGSRNLKDIEDGLKEISKELKEEEELDIEEFEPWLLSKVNSACGDNKLVEIHCEIVSVYGKKLLVIKIPHLPRLLSLGRRLEAKDTSYPKNLVLIRRGQSIDSASPDECNRIQQEKEAWIPPIGTESKSEFYRKLTDIGYIESEIKENRLIDLVGDYSDALKPVHSISQEKQENLRLIQATLRSCQEILTEDSSQLASQLIGRLIFSQSPDIQEILNRVRELQEEQGRSWLEPLSSSLQPPIASLLFKREETKPAQEIAVDTNSSKLVSAFPNGSLKIYDLNNLNFLRTCNKKHTKSVNAIAITPNNEQFISASDDCTLKIWDINTGDLIRSIDAHAGAINAIAITSDGQQIISASDDSTLKFWNLVSGECMDTKPCDDAVTNVVTTNDGQYIAFTVDTTIHILRQGSKEISPIQAHDSQINFLLPFLDQHNLVSASDDKTLKLWDLEQQVCYRELEGFLVVNAAIVPEEKSIIFSDDEGNFGIWHWQTNELNIFEDYRELVNALIVTPDGKRIVTSSGKTISDNDILHVIYVWDLASKQCLITLPDHTDTVSKLTVTLSGQHFISASNDKTLRVWDLLNTHTLDSITKHTAQVDTIVVTPNGEYAVSASTDQTLKLWRVSDGANLKTFNVDGQINHMLIDGQRVFFATDKDNNLFIQDFLLEDAEQKKLSGHTSRVTAIALTPDGQYAISASEDKEDNLKVWSLDIGDIYKPLKGHTAAVTALTIDSDKQWLISVSTNETLIWSLKNLELLYTFNGKFELSAQVVESRSIFPKGQYFIISELESPDLHIWDLSSGKLLLTLEGWKDSVTAVAITPDCKQVISTAPANNLEIWDVQSNRPVRALIKRFHQDFNDEFVPEPAHSQTIKSIVITPCGRCVISASEDHTLKVWDLGKGSNEAIATFTGDSEMTVCAIAPDSTIIVGEKSGRVHFLRLHGI